MFSKNQRLILELFFKKPDQEYYMQQIGRLLKKPAGTLQKALNSLVREGILESKFRANARFFKLNIKHPLYPHYKSIFYKTVGAEGLLQQMFKKFSNIGSILIYGSFAVGKEKSDSDIDLLIIGDFNENKLIQEVSKIEDKIGREINYRHYSRKEFLKKRKSNSFLKNIIKKPKIILKDQYGYFK